MSIYKVKSQTTYTCKPNGTSRVGKVFPRVPEIRAGNAVWNLIIILDGIKIVNHRAASLCSQNSLPGYSNLYKRDKVTGSCFRESNRK